MTLTRRQLIAMGTVLLLVFAIGVFFLVRLGMAASSNATTPTGDNGPAIAGTPGTDGEGDHPAPGTNSNPTIPGSPGVGGADGASKPGTDTTPTVAGTPGTNGRGDHPAPATDTDPSIADNARTNGSGTQPPRPAVMLTDSESLYIPIFSGDGDPVVLKEGEIGGVGIYQAPPYPMPLRIVDVSVSTYEPGNALVLVTPALGENGKECRRGLAIGPESHYLCTVGIRMSESAKPGVRYEGTVGLVFEATCTARTGPCENLPAQYTPSSDNPVTVTFIATGPLIFQKEG